MVATSRRHGRDAAAASGRVTRADNFTAGDGTPFPFGQRSDEGRVGWCNAAVCNLIRSNGVGRNIRRRCPRRRGHIARQCRHARRRDAAAC